MPPSRQLSHAQKKNGGEPRLKMRGRRRLQHPAPDARRTSPLRAGPVAKFLNDVAARDVVKRERVDIAVLD